MDKHRRTTGLPVRLTNDRGASALIIALSMFVIMGFAALAIDWGSALNERRQDQSAADTGALAAAQFAKPNDGCTGAACATQARTNGANEAILVANGSLEDPSLADWSDASLCGTPPAGFVVSPVTACVAFDAGLRRAWVRIPTIDSPTFFARVLGFDSISVSAEAIADTGFNNPGAVLPFLIPGVAASNDYGCLKTGPNPNWGACADAPATGNFGSMDFCLYGNPELGTSSTCGSSTSRLISNIARGVDHPLGRHDTGVGAGVSESDSWPIFSAEPNMVGTQPGNGSALETAMLYGSSVLSINGAYPGRIEGSDFRVRNAGGSTPAADIDATPLWSFLKPGLGTECTGVSDPTAMIDCINWAKLNSTEIFEDSIITSKRFGFTPEVWEANFMTPSYEYHIKGYRPVYIDTTYYKCNNNGCNVAHTVGVADTGPCPVGPAVLITCGTPGDQSDNLTAVTAYILHPDILPPIAKEPGPGDDDQRFYNLSK
jgi:hypothetical protein